MTERNESADQAQDAIRRLKQKLTLADERIRELQAELEAFRGKPSGKRDLRKYQWHHICTKDCICQNEIRKLEILNEDEKARAEKAEAELADVRSDRRLADYYKGEDRKELVARAEKAELEIESCPNKYWHQSVKLRGLVI